MRYNMVQGIGNISGAGGVNPSEEEDIILRRLFEQKLIATTDAKGKGNVLPKTLDAMNADMKALEGFAKTDVKFKAFLQQMLDKKAGGITFEEALTSTEKMATFLNAGG